MWWSTACGLPAKLAQTARQASDKAAGPHFLQGLPAASAVVMTGNISSTWYVCAVARFKFRRNPTGRFNVQSTVRTIAAKSRRGLLLNAQTLPPHRNPTLQAPKELPCCHRAYLNRTLVQTLRVLDLEHGPESPSSTGGGMAADSLRGARAAIAAQCLRRPLVSP